MINIRLKSNKDLDSKISLIKSIEGIKTNSKLFCFLVPLYRENLTLKRENDKLKKQLNIKL